VPVLIAGLVCFHIIEAPWPQVWHHGRNIPSEHVTLFTVTSREKAKSRTFSIRWDELQTIELRSGEF
jgi:hypothetical protein